MIAEILRVFVYSMDVGLKISASRFICLTAMFVMGLYVVLLAKGTRCKLEKIFEEKPQSFSIFMFIPNHRNDNNRIDRE